MRKKLLFLLLATTLSANIVACGSSTTTSENSKEVEELKKQIDELEKENEELKQNSEISETKEDVKEQTAKVKEIKQNDTIETDNLTIKINNVELTYDVLPDDVSGFYTHYEAEPGNVYISVDVTVKNLMKQNLSCDDVMKVTADYNNGYTYSAFPIVKDNSTGFTYSNITSINPLEEKGMKYLINCPQEVEESENPLFLTLDIDGQSYKYTIR